MDLVLLSVLAAQSSCWSRGILAFLTSAVVNSEWGTMIATSTCRKTVPLLACVVRPMERRNRERGNREYGKRGVETGSVEPGSVDRGSAKSGATCLVCAEINIS